MNSLLGALSPDFSATFRRFPLPLILALLGAVLLVLGTNSIWIFGDAAWGRASAGLFTGAAFGVGGVLFAESRPERPRLGLVLKYLLPLLIAFSFHITDGQYLAPFLLCPVAVLWTSIAAFTRIGRGAEREAEQNRFWWLNHQAIATAGIAAAAFAIIALGLMAISQSLESLFSIDMSTAFFRWILPFAGFFLVPAYWLSTLPRLTDYDADKLAHPDFTSKAVGFLGQFLLVPLLLAYGLILLGYAVQILIAGKLPEGTLGWMVLGFVSIGAGTWLVLHPPFLRGRLLVTIFHRSWFWLTLIPLGLFFYAAWVRVDAYGLTSERVMLIGGGLWALALAVIFLARLGDIRLIPGLAAIAFLLMALGPWNVENAPRESQAQRLGVIMDNVGVSSATPIWTMETEREARDIVYFLSSNNGMPQLERVLADHGVPITVSGAYRNDTVFATLKMPDMESPSPSTYETFRREASVDLSETPILVGAASLSDGWPSTLGTIQIGMKDGFLWFSGHLEDPSTDATIDISAWVARQQDGQFADPVIPFTYEGVGYRLVFNSATIENRNDDGIEGRTLSYADGILFRSKAVPPTPTPKYRRAPAR